MLARCFRTASRMTLATTTTHWMRWPLLLAGLLLCLPAAMPQAAPLRLSQLSGELLVPARSAPRPVGGESGQTGQSNDPGAASDCAGQPPADCPGGDGDDPSVPEPRPLELVSPAYPSRAQRLEQDGRVVVCFTVDESGAVREPVVVSSSDTLFNDPVLQAISASRFLPAHSDGQPVKSTACRTYRFVAR